MRTIRLYYPETLQSHNTFTLSTTVSHRIANVLRLSDGAEINVFNGEGGEYRCQIAMVNKRQIKIDVVEFIDRHCESPLTLHLGQAISRGDRMDYTIQKAVELGVTHISPLITARCGVKLSTERWQKRWQHWQGIVISACEQSGRTLIPTLAQPLPLSQWLQQSRTGRKYVLAPEANASLGDNTQASTEHTLLVGSEGGLTEEEIQFAQQHAVKPLRLGPRILRTETAAICLISILQNRCGDIPVT